MLKTIRASVSPGWGPTTVLSDPLTTWSKFLCRPFLTNIFSIHIEYLAVPKDVDSSELLHVSPLLAGVPVSTSTKLRALPYDQLKHYILSEALPDAHQAMSHFLYYGGHSWPHLEPLWLYYYNYLCLCVTSIDPPPIHTRTSRADTISYAHITQHIN